jgi:hypothetical protein
MANKNKARELQDVCVKFVKDNRITCAESVYQSDHVIEHAYEFIEKVCSVVGYCSDEDSE